MDRTQPCQVFVDISTPGRSGILVFDQLVHSDSILGFAHALVHVSATEQIFGRQQLIFIIISASLFVLFCSIFFLTQLRVGITQQTIVSFLELLNGGREILQVFYGIAKIAQFQIAASGIKIRQVGCFRSTVLRKDLQEAGIDIIAVEGQPGRICPVIMQPDFKPKRRICDGLT